MLNGKPSLADIELPKPTEEPVVFYTSHSHYTLSCVRDDSWHLSRVERSTARLTHSLHVRGSGWLAAPVDEGRNVLAPDWRDALRRVIA